MKIRNVSSDARFIGYGLRVGVWVEPVDTVDVPDDVADNYDQPTIWAVVPDTPAPPKAAHAAKSQE